MKISIKLGGFFTMLTLAFVILKLCNIISWNWWWILSPIWFPIVIVLFFALIYFLYLYFSEGKSSLINRRK